VTYPQQPPPPNRPPRRSARGRAGPIALIVGGALLFVASVFVFTAWVVPGFLVADEDPAEARGAGARALATRIMTAFADQDENELRALACADAERPVAAAIQQASGVTAARVTGPVSEQEGLAKVGARISAGGDDIDLALVLDMAGGTWCWRSVEVPGVELRPPR